MVKPIFMCGANGFPIALYKPAMNMIRQQFISKGIIGNTNDISIDGTDVYDKVLEGKDWMPMVNHVIATIETEHTTPVIGIGHSLGGGVIATAAANRPDLFSQLILIEPPLFNYKKRLLLSLLMKLPRRVVSKYHPIIASVYRKRDTFTSRLEAREYLKSKRVFSAMHPDVFELYINECLEPALDGNVITQDTLPLFEDKDSEERPCRMVFSKAAESEVYYRTPMEIPFISSTMTGKYAFGGVPFTFLTNINHPSTILTQKDIEWVCETYNQRGSCFTHLEFIQSHFWPLEDPESFAKVIVDIICCNE